MNSKAAVRASKSGQSALQKRRIKEQKDQEKEERKQQTWELKTQFPKFMKQIRKAIKNATIEGAFKAEWSVNYHLRTKTVDKIREKLEKDKYKVTFSFRSGEENMGDFNAPCMSSWSMTEINISWGSN